MDSLAHNQPSAQQTQTIASRAHYQNSLWYAQHKAYPAHGQTTHRQSSPWPTTPLPANPLAHRAQPTASCPNLAQATDSQAHRKSSPVPEDNRIGPTNPDQLSAWPAQPGAGHGQASPWSHQPMAAPPMAAPAHGRPNPCQPQPIADIAHAARSMAKQPMTARARGRTMVSMASFAQDRPNSFPPQTMVSQPISRLGHEQLYTWDAQSLARPAQTIAIPAHSQSRQ
jgi:hypothetical protein